MLTLTLSTLAGTLAFAPASPSASAPREPAETREAAGEPSIWRRFGGFVGVDWRVMGIGGHISHGPGFQAGAIFFDHLMIGFAGITRPGPINPATFAYDLAEGQTYKGKSTLRLRSDGTVLGLFIAPFHDFRRVPLSLELPIMLGYGGFGFYLHGEDRKVPDDRRVSAWENDLLGGRDSDPTNIAVDVGLRLTWTPRATPHMRPYLGVHYMWLPGFDTALRSNYDGFSGVLGIKFGKFPKRR